MQLNSIRKFLIIGLLSIMTVAHLAIMAWSYRETYKEAEELQDAQLAQYARALRLMFVGYTAYELRTPLADIGVHLQNASRKTGKEKENAIALSLKGHRRMVHLVEQLLVLARTTPDAYFANFQEVNLYGTCQRVIAEHIQLFLNKEQKVTLNGDDKICINGDVVGLEILISNLVRNASLYYPKEGSLG